jgi:hypothetical protein
MGQLTLSMRPARAEVHSFVQRATIPSKKVIFFTFSIYTRHIWDNIFYLLSYHALQNNTFSPLQVKNKPRDRDSKHAFILGSIDGTVQTVLACNQLKFMFRLQN